MTKIVTTPNAAASQTEHPWRATVRTGVQAALLAFPLLLALPEILSIVDDELGHYLSEDARGWLALVAGVIAAGAAAVTRVMAVPAVEAALRGINFGAAPAEVFLPDEAVDPPEGDPALDEGEDAVPEGDADDEAPVVLVDDDGGGDAEPDGPADDDL